ncbi:FeoB-associated Cys-rich membrane protein [Actinobacillus porcinus]|nr:FeoB-associated Cys-rich membrane protein [Actinobacillus porcinus]MCI5763951.1 FeoB-associated Cys-rich membrane protein [Actinobacillus porcinus]MDY5422532.1 FeoB-associated Cys-rich membrane protein [Actinobacillus porcinus]
MIQNIIVGIIGIACVSYIVWKFVLNRKRGVCNGCDKCCSKKGSCH